MFFFLIADNTPVFYRGKHMTVRTEKKKSLASLGSLVTKVVMQAHCWLYPPAPLLALNAGKSRQIYIYLF